MGVRRVTPPEVEPISLAEAEAHVFLDGEAATAQSARNPRTIAAAREYVEDATGRSLITQTWELTLDRFPCADDPQGAVILLPMGNVQEVTGITYLDEDGVQQTLDPSVYVLVASENPARVGLEVDQAWPATRNRIGAVTVTYSAGYGDTAAAVPEKLRQAVLLLFGHWHRNTEAVVTGTIATAVQHSLDEILNSYRINR